MNTKREKITLFAIVLGLSLLHGEPYEVGDYVTNFTDSLCSVEQEWSLFDYYYTENGGNKNVIWLVFFNTNSRRCQLEASYTQSIHNLYKNQGLITVGIGSGWSESVNCNNWTKTYGLTYPIIDDERLNLRSLFTDSSVPHHVVIDHNMQIVYNEKGTIVPPYGADFVVSLNSALQSMSSLSANENVLISDSPALSVCYPNPFNNTTTISYELKDHSPVNISVIDLTGRSKQTIFEVSSQSPGAHSFSWNADNFSSGVYFIELVTENYVSHQKVLLVK